MSRASVGAKLKPTPSLKPKVLCTSMMVSTATSNIDGDAGTSGRAQRPNLHRVQWQ